MSTNAARPGRRGSRLRAILGILLLVAIVAAGLVTFQVLKNGGAGPATAQTTEVEADSTAAENDDGDEKKGKKDDDEEERDERIPVEVATAERRDVPSYFSGRPASRPTTRHASSHAPTVRS